MSAGVHRIMATKALSDQRSEYRDSTLVEGNSSSRCR